MPETTQPAPWTVTMPVGIVMRRSRGVTRWARWAWRVTSVFPGAGDADWRELTRHGEAVDFHAATLPLALHRGETEAYQHNLQSRLPAAYVILRPGLNGHPPQPALVTASPYEAQDYADSGEEIVERVALGALMQTVAAFVEAHHEDDAFVKRRRKGDRRDVQDGVGDARIAQATDVYRAPRRRVAS